MSLLYRIYHIGPRTAATAAIPIIVSKNTSDKANTTTKNTKYDVSSFIVYSIGPNRTYFFIHALHNTRAPYDIRIAKNNQTHTGILRTPANYIEQFIGKRQLRLQQLLQQLHPLWNRRSFLQCPQR